ncbi:MAG: kdtA waaA, partial [Rhodocyclales bacterium]|nr:kdtA waaA [Rhodocyclales bacterium]
ARLGGLARRAFAGFNVIAAQSEDDATRLRALAGEAVARTVCVTGNIKYDVGVSAALRERGTMFKSLTENRLVVLAASTREGEEALMLDAFRAQAPSNVLLVLVPRHPQRFDAVAELVQRAGLPLQRRSDQTSVDAATRVWLGDSMGEMGAYYAMADVSLIGGSWLPFGSQNLIESCAAGVPVMVGPHSFNFADAAEKAIEAGAALRCADVETGMQAALALLKDTQRRNAMSHAGLAFYKLHGGATARLMKLIREVLDH